MKQHLRTLAVGVACAVLAAAPIAWSAGLWETLPQVAGPSFCASTVTGIGLPAGQGPYGVVPGSTQGTSVGICQSTVPAGPPSITGLETAPVDLNPHSASNQGPTQTGTLEMQQLSAGYTYQAINSTNQATLNGTAVGTAFQIPQTALLVLDPTTTVANVTLQFPLAPLDGDHLRIASTATITALVITPGVATVTFKGIKPTTLPTAQAANTTASQEPTELEFVYNAAYTAWMRLQ